MKTAFPRIVAPRNLIIRFKTMVVAKETDGLALSLRNAVDREIAYCTSSVRAVDAAERATTDEPYTSDLIEAEFSNVKLVMLQMCGSGKIVPLSARTLQRVSYKYLSFSEYASKPNFIDHLHEGTFRICFKKLLCSEDERICDPMPQ